jgi:hypothetical protein
MTNDGFAYDCCWVLMDYNEAKNAIMFGFVTNFNENPSQSSLLNRYLDFR